MYIVKRKGEVMNEKKGKGNDSHHLETKSPTQFPVWEEKS